MTFVLRGLSGPPYQKRPSASVVCHPHARKSAKEGVESRKRLPDSTGLVKKVKPKLREFLAHVISGVFFLHLKESFLTSPSGAMLYPPPPTSSISSSLVASAATAAAFGYSSSYRSLIPEHSSNAIYMNARFDDHISPHSLSINSARGCVISLQSCAPTSSWHPCNT